MSSFRYFAEYLCTKTTFFVNYEDVNDLDERLFFDLVELCRGCNNPKPETAIDFVVRMYRFAAVSFEYRGLDGSRILSIPLLNYGRLPQYLAEGYYIAPADPKNPPVGHDKVLFVHEDKGRWFSCVGASFEELESAFYRDVLIRYCASLQVVSIKNIQNARSYLTRTLNKLTFAKHQPKYPTSDETVITAAEACLVQEDISNRKDLGLGTRNTWIGHVRHFFKWGKQCGFLQVDAVAFDYLRRNANPTQVHGNPVPNERLAAMTTGLQRKAAEGDDVDALVYLVFRLCLETEFRLATILALRTDSIRPSFRPGNYRIVAATKATRGKEEFYEITESTYRLILSAIERTDELRTTAPSAFSQQIFLYRGRSHRTVVLRPATVQARMKSMCRELGFSEIYTPSNLRDTYMTNAVLYALENKRNDIEISLMSKHKSFDTTLNHYVGDMLTEMLEATYGITIGDMTYLQAADKVVAALPPTLDNPAHEVERGCGVCDRDACLELEAGAYTTLPCFMCQHFRTTPKHLRYFESAVEAVDARFETIIDPHDKDDALTVKRILVSFIKAIVEFQELDRR